MTIISSAQEVILPESIADKVIIELLEKDSLKVRLRATQGLVKIYKHLDSANVATIREYALNERDFKKVIQNLEEVNKISEDQVKQLRRQLFTTKLKFLFITIGEALIIVLLIV